MIGTLADVTAAVTAVVGLFVATLAFSGYRRNDSPVMLALAAGVVAIAVVPFLVAQLLVPLLNVSDAVALVLILLSHTLGLVAIYRTFRG